MELFHSSVQFHLYNYIKNSHHFIPDTRVTSDKFNLTNALGQYDAQWYLRNSVLGYPKSPRNEDIDDKSRMDGLSYAFFPLYPTFISIPNMLIGNIEYSAFLTANLLMILNFFSLFYVLRKISGEKIALKTTFLLFLFPFSIFYRSYFSEGLFLFILIWFFYFWHINKLQASSLLLGLLNITRGSAVLLFPLYFYDLFKEVKSKKLTLEGFAKNLITAFLPLSIWTFLVYLNTGDLFYFFKIREAWTGNLNTFILFADNINSMLGFFSSYFHELDSSKVETIVILVFGLILFISRNILPRKLWLIGLSLWLTPLLFNPTMSFSRMQSVSFPLFLYLATILKGRSYYLVAGIFGIILFIVSLYFINWWWVG